MDNTEDIHRIFTTFFESLYPRIVSRLGDSACLDTSVAKGKYILEIQYVNSRDSHHLIID